jgi:hypothetical protein
VASWQVGGTANITCCLSPFTRILPMIVSAQQFKAEGGIFSACFSEHNAGFRNWLVLAFV